MQKENIIRLCKKTFPFFLILFFSVLGTYIVFLKGLFKGDDYYFHATDIYEWYNSVINGEKFSPISENSAMGLGVGNRLFYSPLSHFTVVLIGVFLKLFNVSLIVSFKIVIILMIFISGVFTYFFALRFTSKNKNASLFTASCFVIFPYRAFNVFRRFAFAEAFAMTFLPLFFMGLYDILHFKEKINVTAFAEVILGGAFLVLSHNITALYGFIFGIIYILININSLIKSFKIKHYFLFCVISVILIIGISSISLFSQFELLKDELYIVSNKEIMGTDVSSVTSQQAFWKIISHSGFGFGNIKNFARFIWFIISCIITIFTDFYIKKIKNLKTAYRYLILFILLFVFNIFFINSASILSVIIFYFLYVYVDYSIKKGKQKEVYVEKSILKDKLFWFSVSAILICFAFMIFGFVWKILPSFMLNIQFPWRLWSFIQLFLSIIVGLICYYFDKKQIIFTFLSIFFAICIICNKGIIVKEEQFKNKDEYPYYSTFGWSYTLNDDLYKAKYSLGFKNDYIPQIFSLKDYVPKYSASLYYDIKKAICLDEEDMVITGEKYTFNPVILNGNGTIEVIKRKTPYYLIKINATQETKIQIPLFYYPGYSVKVKNLETNKTKSIATENVDGLLSFDVSVGNYEITINYKGTALRKTSIILNVTCSSVVVGYFIYKIASKKIAKKKSVFKGEIDTSI